MRVTAVTQANRLLRAGAIPRWLSLGQVAGSALGTVFYTPGGAAGWALDLVLRLVFAMRAGRGR